jgi:hypothetical protein
MKDSGRSLLELKGAGYSAGELSRGCYMYPASELLQAGYPVREMKEADVSPKGLTKIVTLLN